MGVGILDQDMIYSLLTPSKSANVIQEEESTYI
jgi:hypothetical protein